MANGLTYKRKTRSVDMTKAFAATLAQYVRPGDVIMLSGDLGAGKTQFTQGFAEGLGINAPVVSPTFNIVLSYPDGRIPLFHFDLYRLEEPEELEDIAYFETIEGDGVSLVEWGDKFDEAHGYDYLEVRISVNGEGEREFTIHAVGTRSRSLVTVWANDSRSRLNKLG